MNEVGSRAVSVSRRREQKIVFLLVGAYAAVYVCRANVEPGLNLLSVQYGYDNEQTGVVFAVALAAYAVGKVILGAVGDVVGGKRILLASMLGSVGASLGVGALAWPEVLGPGPALWVMGGFVVVNRFAQSGGWGGVVHVASRSFPAERRGAVMGLVSTSFDLGNVAALLLCSWMVARGAGWRALFVVNPILLAAMAAVVAVGLDGRKEEAKAKENADAEAEAEAEADADADADPPLRDVLRRLVRVRAFWMAVAMSFLLTFVRAGFMTWTPKYLYDVSVAAGSASALSGSIAKSAFFGLAGMTGSLVVGRLSDRWGPGRRAGIMTASLVVLLGAVVLLGHGHVRSPLGAAAIIGMAGLFLLGPYSLLGGAITLDVAGKRGAATTVGFVDGVGYVGASLAAAALGSVSKRAGWSAAFDVIAAVIALAVVLAGSWWWRTRRGATP